MTTRVTETVITHFECEPFRVEVAMPAAWTLTRVGDAVRISAASPSGAVLTVTAIDGVDARTALDREVLAASSILTDYAILHLSRRDVAAGGEDILAPFVFGVFRQGPLTMALDMGVVSQANGAVLFVSAQCVLELLPVFTTLLNQTINSISLLA